MQELLSERLYKTGEHGEGKHVLVVYSDYTPTPILPYKDLVGSQWKMHYFCLDLNDTESKISAKLENTFNYYHYASTLVLDFPAFLYFLSNIERITLASSVLHKIVIYNPLGMPYTLGERIKEFFITRAYLNLVGSKVSLPAGLSKQFHVIIDKIEMMHANDVTVVGLSDPKSAFHIAAHIRNSNYVLCKSYQDTVSCLMEVLD